MAGSHCLTCETSIDAFAGICIPQMRSVHVLCKRVPMRLLLPGFQEAGPIALAQPLSEPTAMLLLRVPRFSSTKRLRLKSAGMGAQAAGSALHVWAACTVQGVHVRPLLWQAMRVPPSSWRAAVHLPDTLQW